jgi:hypothetical protein
MSGSSNFLQWNPAQVNQETDSAYAADAQRTGGAQVNIPAPSATLNKLFYQTSTFCAAFGEMMANKGYVVSDASESVLAAVLANILTDADQLPTIITVGYSPTPNFNAGAATGFQMTLAGNITASTVSGVIPGQLLAFYFKQDATGGRTVSWPSSFVGALAPDPTPNAMSLMLFRVDLSGVPRAVSPLISNNGTFVGPLSASSITLAAGAPAGSHLIGTGTSFVAKSYGLVSKMGTYSLGVPYQNTSAAEAEEEVTFYLTGSYGQAAGLSASIGPTSTGLIFLKTITIGNSSGRQTLGFKVPKGYWFEVYQDNTDLSNPQTPNIAAWFEGTYS